MNYIRPPNGSLFIMTSTIDATRGIFTFNDRLSQTFETILSIKKHAPDSVIIIAESSINPLSDQAVKAFQDAGAYTVIRFAADSDIVQLSKQNQNSPAEIRIMMETLLLLRDRKYPQLQQMMLGVKRIFKISGRYQLTSCFSNNDTIQDNFGKYIFRTRYQSWMTVARIAETGCTDLLPTRLWSMCPSLINEFLSICPAIYNDCTKLGVDLEHAMFKHINKARLIEVNPVGVKGQVALSGEETYD